MGGRGGYDLRERDDVRGWDPNPRQQRCLLARGKHDGSSGERENRVLSMSVLCVIARVRVEHTRQMFPSVRSVEATTRHDASEQVSARAVVSVYHHLVLRGRVVEMVVRGRGNKSINTRLLSISLSPSRPEVIIMWM